MANANCPDELLLWALVREELSREEKAAVEEHCQSCSFCRETLVEIGKVDPISNPAGARAQYESFLKKRTLSQGGTSETPLPPRGGGSRPR